MSEKEIMSFNMINKTRGVRLSYLRLSQLILAQRSQRNSSKKVLEIEIVIQKVLEKVIQKGIKV